LIISHGYPSSVVEFLNIIGLLTDRRAHGGDPADAFHVVAHPTSWSATCRSSSVASGDG